MINQVQAIVAELNDKLVAHRRDFHRYAESGWTEYRTASRVARALTNLGYEVQLGREVVHETGRMGVPSRDILERHWQRALDQGGDRAYMEAIRGGFTGVVGTLKNGSGPTIALRFDMDALDLQESQSPEHRPAREGFVSVNPGVAHACGHDGHTAIGLGIAETLVRLRDTFRGTVRLVFQPAEEGVRGAKSMVLAGVLDAVDYFLGFHLHGDLGPHELTCGLGACAATYKFDAFFAGEPAHAGVNPEQGNNALLAAATAVLNLYAIPRHGSGATRINVGRLTAGQGRNVICPNAHLVAETRGETNELSDYMYARAMQILTSAAEMHGCQLDVVSMGEAPTATSDAGLTERVTSVARRIGGYSFVPPSGSGGSEDITYMVKRVQETGGSASHISIGANLHGLDRKSPMRDEYPVLGPHTSVFDFDEGALQRATELLTCTVLELLGPQEN